MNLLVQLDDLPSEAEVLNLYKANRWSAADKPAQLMAALRNSHALVTARVDARLVGLGNAISDGYLVVYYPHMLVHPEYQRLGIGKKMMLAMQEIYAGFHQQVLVADGNTVDFYKSLGFHRAGITEPMWIYSGTDH